MVGINQGAVFLAKNKNQPEGRFFNGALDRKSNRRWRSSLEGVSTPSNTIPRKRWGTAVPQTPSVRFLRDKTKKPLTQLLLFCALDRNRTCIASFGGLRPIR